MSPLPLHGSAPTFQWRASGWSGGRGHGAASPVTQGRSRDSGAAVRRPTAGLNAGAPIRRAEIAPTPPAAVRVLMYSYSHTLKCHFGNKEHALSNDIMG